MGFESVETQARKKLLAFLRDTADAFTLKQHFREFYKRIVHIQLSYRERVQCLANRREFLTRYFEEERGFLVKFYIQKKTKRSKTLVTRLNLIDQ